MERTIEGLKVVITGASAGIGNALSKELARRGAALAVCARRAEALRALEQEHGEQPGSIRGFVCDVSKPKQVLDFANAAADHLGGVDVLINNAGYLGPRARVEDHDIEEFAKVLNTNVLGLFALTKSCLKHLVSAPPGIVINVSSGLGRFGVARSSSYCASKFAVEGFTQSLCDEYDGETLISLAMSPGMVATDMLSAYMDGADVSEHRAASDVALGFVRVIERAGPGWTGRSLNIEDFLT